MLWAIDIEGDRADLASPRCVGRARSEVQTVLHGNVLEEAILRGRRRRKGRPRAGQSRCGSPHRRTDTDRVAESELEDGPRAGAPAQALGCRSQGRHEVRGAQLEEGGQKEKPTTLVWSPAFQDGSDVTIDGVARDEARLRLVGAIEISVSSVDEESRGEAACTPRFFWPEP